MASINRDIAKILGRTEAANPDNVALGSGSGLTVYATPSLLPTSGLSAGDQAFVTSNSRIYISNGSGWYNVALINSTPTFTSGPNAAYALATDLTPTVISLVAQDSDGQVVTYSATPSGMDGIATLSQDSSVFTVTPLHDSAGGAGSFTITFQATDGIGIASSASTFTLAFNANYTNKLDGTNYRMGTSAGGSFTTTTPFSRAGEYSFRVSGNGDTQRRPGHFTSPPSFTFNDYTISFWFRINAFSGGSAVHLFNSNDKTGSSNSFGTAGNAIGSNGSSFNFCTDKWNGSSYGGFGTSSSFGVNKWYHAVFTASTTGPTIGCWVTELGQTFANKINVTTFGGSGFASRVAGLKVADITGFYLHGSIGNTSDGGNVTYDDLRIYDAKATATDAESIFNSNGLVDLDTNPMQSNLRLAYKFDNDTLSI